MFEHKATYQYLEFPVLARLTYTAQIRKRYFKWYVNAGGTLNFWLAGSGYIKSYEYDESNVERLEYTIKFHEKPENAIDQTFIIYLSDLWHKRLLSSLPEYYEDFRTMEHILSLSVVYLFEYNIGQRRKGSTTGGAKIKAKSVGKAPSKKGQNINKIKKNKRRN